MHVIQKTLTDVRSILGFLILHELNIFIVIAIIKACQLSIF